ncbi:hypothetical protein [Formosa sp. S-31]|uniref:hypothetical protein n=1 Tax=Formosa sp. S-31 TaxID=2790949 RepID=UPI003EB9F3E5
MRSLILILIFSIPFLGVSQRQEDINPFRIAIKTGFPSGVGLEAEFVTPLLGNRIAPFVDYAMIPINDIDSKYFEAGTNIYFRSIGKSGYASLSYANLDAEVSGLSGEDIDGRDFRNGTVKEQLESFNVKLGWKYGRAVYCIIEAGYAFGKLPRSLDVTGDVNGQRETFRVTYDELFDIISGNGYPILNFGIGYSF